MDPNVNPQEYLNQIAVKKPGLFSHIDKKMAILAGAVILLIITVIVWVAVSNAPKQSSATELLAVRLQNMDELLSYNNNKTIDSNSKKAIAETKIIFASDNYQLSQSMTLTVKPEVAAKEPIDSIIASLDKAASSNNLSKEYTSALRVQIDQIINSLKEIQADSNSYPVEQSLLDFTELSNRLSDN